MSFHGKMARQAYLKGHASEEFKGAAQRHANAAWIFAILTGLVWYFVSWRWAMIPLVVTAWTTFQSISASLIAMEIEKFEAP